MRRLLTAVALLLLSLGLHARDENVYLEYGGVYHTYRHGDLTDTRAPRGYKAFYISHIGRHGSRFPVDRKYVTNALFPLMKADSLGILTDEGRRLMRGFAELDSISTGVYGLLCPVGAREHKGIAERMVKRFPTVFSGRDSVAAVSTHKQRCIMSATNFIGELRASAPGVDVGFVAGEKYYDYLCREEMAKPGLHTGSVKSDAFMAARMDFTAMFSRFFTDPAAGRALFDSDRILPEKIYTNGAVADYLGMHDLMHCLTPEEYVVTSVSYNNKMYIQHCNSAEQGQWRTSLMKPLLKDFIDKADAAMEPGGVAADLRFSHDVGMMPFFSLLGIEPYSKSVYFDDAYGVWNSSVTMPMATNMQMVFYRHPRRQTILVKILFNEEETSIPALGPGPYYDWEALRGYLISRL